MTNDAVPDPRWGGGGWGWGWGIRGVTPEFFGLSVGLYENSHGLGP